MTFNPEVGKLDIQDVSLRDGMHVILHMHGVGSVRTIAKVLDEAGVDAIEVSHGGGLNGTSFNDGFGSHADWEWIEVAADAMNNTVLTTLLGSEIVEEPQREPGLPLAADRKGWNHGCDVVVSALAA